MKWFPLTLRQLIATPCQRLLKYAMLPVVVAALLSEIGSTLRNGLCNKPMSELSFNAIVHGLFNEPGAIRSGDVLDVGARDGSWSCMYACQQPERTVRAVDPSRKLVRTLGSCMKAHRNLRTYVAAVSNASGVLHGKTEGGVGFDMSIQIGDIQQSSAARTDNSNPAHDVAVRTIDSLVEEWNSPLGFAHLDLEGMEALAVLGMRSTLARDRPVFSMELAAHHPAAETLLRLVQSLSYTSYVVQEQCGMRFDCRNVINFPNEHLHNLLDSPTLDLAARYSVIAFVNASNIKKFSRLQPKTVGNAWLCSNK